jgi:hypothetical protein
LPFYQSDVNYNGCWLLHHHRLRLHHHGLHDGLHDRLHYWLLRDVHLIRSLGKLSGSILGYVNSLLAAAVTADADKDNDEDDAANNTTNNCSCYAACTLGVVRPCHIIKCIACCI